MNKLLKGALAGAAGVTLLLGGAGTFALWNSSAIVNVGSVASGTLTLTASGSPTWKNVSSDGPAGGTIIPSISSFKMVPGDTVELTQVLTVTATGDSLKATLTYDDTTIAAVGPAASALKSALVFGVNVTGAPNITRVGVGNTFSVTPSAAPSTVTATVTITLPSSVSATTAQGGVVDLSALAFKLQQVRP